MSSGRKIEARELSGMLADRINGVVSYLGLDASPAYQSRNVLYPLNPTRGDRHPGSMYVYLAGERRGLWADRATGDHGDALDLVAYVNYGRDLGAAYKWALGWLGLENVDAPEIRKRADEAKRAREIREKEAAAKAEKMRKSALALWLGERGTPTTPALPGGLCDLYLKGRGIDMVERLGRLPGCVRESMALKTPAGWLGKAGRSHAPALLLQVNDARGPLACHRIYLDVSWQGDKPVAARKAQLDPVDPSKFPNGLPKNRSKFVYGDFWGGTIRVWRGPTGKPLGGAVEDEPVVITEGFENACAIAVSLAGTDDERRVLASLSLSNMGNVELPETIRSVHLIGENDGSPEARKSFERACQMHIDAGRSVWRTWPPAEVAGKAVNDVNDLLLAGASA